jgi:MFS transporter, PAT family, solute carrier family 33 (acetyl-CoA transportor), member 1
MPVPESEPSLLQDIAVDGWALTLLSKRHVGYASTCQTVGMNFGYFTSITIFLALNDASFCNRFLRAADSSSLEGLVSLTLYMRFWAFAYAVVTAVVWVAKREKPPSPSYASPHFLSALNPL